MKVLLLLLSVSIFTLFPIEPGLTSPIKQVLPQFQPILSQAKEKTKISLVLPNWIPVSLYLSSPPLPAPTPLQGGQLAPFFAHISQLNHSTYRIDLNLTKDCWGARVCGNFGSLSGEKITANMPHIPEEFSELSQLYQQDPKQQQPPVIRSPEPPTLVRLEKGIMGYFIPYTCAAYCGNSSVIWDWRGVRYRVELEMAAKETVIKMANSAILASGG